MTVRELVFKLTEFPPDMEVWPFNHDDSDWASYELDGPKAVTMYGDSHGWWVSAQHWHRYDEPDIAQLADRFPHRKDVVGL